MKKIFFLSMIIISFFSCKTLKYIPVDSIRTEYRDKFIRDSIIRYDSIFVKEKGDTLIIERYKYLYCNKIINDSIFINDTIRVPYPVEVIKNVKAPLTGWQNFQVWCGRMALAILLFVSIFYMRNSIKLK